MTREEYVNMMNNTVRKIYTSIIQDVKQRVENINVYERCELSDEQVFLINNKQLESTIVKELEEMYPFLTFKLSNWNMFISWKLKEEN